MTYSLLELQLVKLLKDLGVNPLPDIDVSKIKLCAYCGEILRAKFSFQKFHPACAKKHSKEQKQTYYQTHKPQYKARDKRYKEAPKCTCCGIRPIAAGNRFLCSLCYAYDGDDWKQIYQENSDDGKAIIGNAEKQGEGGYSPAMAKKQRTGIRIEAGQIYLPSLRQKTIHGKGKGTKGNRAPSQRH